MVLAQMRFVRGGEGARCGGEAASLWEAEKEHDVGSPASP